jgi:conjugal transfer/entry exclusion protein
VDQEAVEYYKKYWGEAGDQSASEFAQQLVSDYGTQKAAQDLSAKEARIKRAYDLAYQMRDQKLIGGAQVSEQVNQILKWNDEGFESVKGLVAQNSLAKTAMPQVGITNPQDVVLLPGNPDSADAADLKTALAALFDEPRVGLKV